MEVQWIALGISAVAIVMAGIGISIGLVSWSRSSDRPRYARTPNRTIQRSSVISTQARQGITGEYFARFKEQIESAAIRGSISEAGELRGQYEWELECWRALENLRLLAQRELGARAEGLREDELDTLRDLIKHAVELPDAFFSDDDFYLCGNTYYELDRFEEAIIGYSRCLRLNPAHAHALNNRGMCHFSLGQLQRAHRDFSEALATKSNFSQAYTNRGLVYLNLNRNKETVRDCSKAIRLDPRSPNSHIVRGLAYVNLGKHARAVKDYNRAIFLSPESAEAYNNRGAAYVKLSQYQRAIQDYTESIQLNPEFSLAYNNRGLAFFNLGQHQQAIEDYSTAIELNPDFAQAYHNRGLAYFQTGNNQLAIQDYDAANRLNSQNGDSPELEALSGPN